MKKLVYFLVGAIIATAIGVYASKITVYDELAETPASDDLFIIVDVSDTTMAPTGTTKKLKSQYLAATNVTLVPIDGDINTYITAATAGDTLELAPGTYTITASLNVSKQLNIIGQGNAGLYSVAEGDLHGTRILCATANIPIFNITSSNVRIAHMSLYHSGAGDVTGAVGFKVANNLDGIVFTNVDIVMPSGAGLKTGYDILGSIALLRDCAFYVTSTDGRAYGVYAHNDDSTTINAIIDCHTVSGTTIGGAIRSAPFYVYNDNDANTITMNLFSCWGKSTDATANDCGAFADSLTTNNAKLNVYQTTLDGGDYDIEQSGTNTVTIYGGILVNNTTNGTITYGGTVAAQVFTGTITNAANVAMLNESTDTTCFPYFGTTSTPGNVPLKTTANLKFNSNTGELESTILAATGNVKGATYGSDSSILDAELLTLDDGATTQILVGGGAGSAPVWGADLPTAVTIGGAYIYRAGGTDVPDGDVADDITITNISQVQDISASASEINTPLDGASVTLTEFRELETIGDTTISANQWTVLGGIAETLAAAELDILDGVTGVTAAELSYIGDVTSLIQAQIDGKEGTLTNEAGLYAALSDVALFLEDLVDDTTPQLGGPFDWNSQVQFDDSTALVDGDTTPNVSAATVFKTANSGATTISDFDDTDDHGDFQDGKFIWLWVDDANTTFDFTSSELTWASQGANDYAASEDDHFIFKFDNSVDQWLVVSGPMPSVVSVSSITLPQGTDPDLDASGKISHDTDGANEAGDESIRGHDGTNQFLIARKLKCFQATIIAPNDLADATRDACPIWSNETGMTFTVTKIEAWSDTDDTTLNVEEEDADGANNATVDALEIATDGTGMYYTTETTITGATIEANHIILLDFDDTDDPGWVKVSICGWFNADVD